MDDEINRKIIDLNLTSAIMSCRTFTPLFKKQGYGKIINVSSACDRRCWQGWSVYSAAKAAVNSFTKCLYTELRPHGIAVTLLVPGGSNTGFQAAAAGVSKFEWDEELAVRPEHFADMVYQTCALTRGGCVTEMLVYGLAQDVSGYLRLACLRRRRGASPARHECQLSQLREEKFQVKKQLFTLLGVLVRHQHGPDRLWRRGDARPRGSRSDRGPEGRTYRRPRGHRSPEGRTDCSPGGRRGRLQAGDGQADEDRVLRV